MVAGFCGHIFLPSVVFISITSDYKTMREGVIDMKVITQKQLKDLQDEYAILYEMQKDAEGWTLNYYDRFEELERIFDKLDLGVIKVYA